MCLTSHNNINNQVKAKCYWELSQIIPTLQLEDLRFPQPPKYPSVTLKNNVSVGR